jgi:1,4-dihydroxy-2-naphthoate octaprenyltransferase
MSDRRWIAWLLATRPKTLAASVAPVLMGTAVAHADGGLHAGAALAALAAALLIQIGTNLANDYFDWRRGADAGDRLGPTRVTQAGLIAPAAVRLGFIACFGLALVPGGYLLMRGGLPVLAIGATAIVCGVLYTAGPRPLGYVGLGDLFAFLYFGPIAVAGTHYVQSLAWSRIAIVAGCAPGFLAAAILTVNNYRDHASDRRARKRTLAVQLGLTFARIEYVVLMLGAAAVPALLVWHEGAPRGILVASALCLVALPVLGRRLMQPPQAPEAGARLNRTLAATGQLELLFAICFALGWVVQ